MCLRPHARRMASVLLRVICGRILPFAFSSAMALSCLPQISQICTDAFHVQPAKESVLIRRAGGASKTKQ